jgi:hypothetical protein
MADTPFSGSDPASSASNVQPRGEVHKAAERPAKRLVVAVHGVGDQFRKATLQAVVKQFCRACGEPTGIPLGAFHNEHSTYMSDQLRPKLSTYAFAEVYWAETPQKVVEDRHTLEGAKAWAETLVERVRIRSAGKTGHALCSDEDTKLATQVLREMIETVAVSERLCYLADKAGLFTFDLRRILDDYLGDVQVVAEFATKRREILDTFRETMAAAYAQCEPGAPVVIVAHSEGTVVALLGLLEAFRKRGNEVPAWATNVRGLMTIGSPIDKHLYLWPELFDGPPPTKTPDANKKIVWHNYYDFGDPIGFKLDAVRERIEQSTPPDGAHGWSDVFDFRQSHDHGFSRYVFPGKAHVDYWNDGELFGHFIAQVSDPGFLTGEKPPPVPTSRPWPAIVSRVVPYVGVWALLFVGTFVLFKAGILAMYPEDGPGTRAILREVTSLSMLLFGVTIAARVPRLTKSIATRIFAGLFAVACIAIYAAMSGEVKHPLQFSGAEAGGTYVVSALLLIGVTWLLAVFLPRQGALPMIAVGGAMSAILLILRLKGHIEGPAWPVVLAFGLYLYFWWLAALLFDLVVVWHIYIRSSVVNDRLNALTRTERDRTRWVTPRQQPV